MSKRISFIFIVGLFLSCSPKTTTSVNTKKKEKVKKEIVKPKPICNVEATIKDFSDLDGCSLVFELADGTKLEAAALPNLDFELENYVQVKIAYDLPDQEFVSACMMQTTVVNVTCIEKIADAPIVNIDPSKEVIIEEKPIKSDCIETFDPFSVDWMKNLFAQLNPEDISRYKYNDGFAYVYKSKSQFAIYDCQGTRLCAGAKESDCEQRMQMLTDKVVLVKAEN